VQARAIALQRDRARDEATTAREVSEFLVGVFEVSDPMVPGASDSVRAADLLERGAERIENDLAGQPGIQARLLTVIGRAFGNLRQNDRAEPLISRAVALQRTNAETDAAEVVTTLQQLAAVQVGRGEEEAAETALRDAIAIQGTVDPASPTMWSLLVDLAYTIHASGDYQRGTEAVSNALALWPDVAADDLRDVRSSLRRMAEMLGFGPDNAYQDSLFSRLVDVERQSAGERSTPVAAALLGWSRAKMVPAPDVAASLAAEATDILMELDPRSLSTAQALRERAGMSRDRVRAEEFARQAEEIYMEKLGADHLDVAITRSNIADALQGQGRLEEAVEVRRLANVVFRRENHVLLPMSEAMVGNALRDLGRPAEAAPVLESALRNFEEHYPPDYLLAANARRDYGDVLVSVGRPADAEPVLLRAIDVLGARWGEEDYRVDLARISLGRALTALGRNDEARTVLRSVADRLEAARGPDDDYVRRAREALAAVDGSG
jgi:tetratricopeptide (TPR) repeat protein